LPNKGVVSFNPQHNGARSAEKIELSNSADIDAPWHLASMSPHHGPSLAVRQHAREGGESWLALCFSGVRPRRRFSYFSLSVDLRITVVSPIMVPLTQNCQKLPQRYSHFSPQPRHRFARSKAHLVGFLPGHKTLWLLSYESFWFARKTDRKWRCVPIVVHLNARPVRTANTRFRSERGPPRLSFSR
jgi:hypothetical protein